MAAALLLALLRMRCFHGAPAPPTATPAQVQAAGGEADTTVDVVRSSPNPTTTRRNSPQLITPRCSSLHPTETHHTAPLLTAHQHTSTSTTKQHHRTTDTYTIIHDGQQRATPFHTGQQP